MPPSERLILTEPRPVMGFQDRDYYRESSQSIYVTSMVIKLIILNGIVFLAEVIAGWDLTDRDGVTSLLATSDMTRVRPLYWWQFLTAGFVHSKELPHILFNMLGLYCVGIPLEDRYGRREFLRFYLVAIVLGFIVWSASHHFLMPHAGREVLCYGASGGVTAATLLFCL